MKKLLIVLLFLPSIAFAAHRHHQYVPAPTPPPSSSEISIQAWTTAYTYWDNDPPGTANIALPVLHSKAGGSGSYTDPITLAVGLSGNTLDYPAGTRFYMPSLEKYFIVEDTCANCHAGHNGYVHVDMWIDGNNVSASTADACAYNVTDIHTIIENPKSTYPVNPGGIINGGCKIF